MDPFSLTAGVVGLLAITATVIDTLDTYTRSIQDRKQDIQDLRQELILLGGVLQQLKDFLSSDKVKQTSIDTSSVLSIAITDCTKRLQRVADRIKPSTGGKLLRAIDKLKWPFEQDEVYKVVSSLQRFIQTFSFALHVTGLTILTKTSDNIEAALEKQRLKYENRIEEDRQDDLPTAGLEAKVEQVNQLLSILPSILDQAGEIKEMSQQLRMQEEREQARLMTEILEWLAPASSLQKHLETQKRHVSKTCSWFLESQRFKEWITADTTAHDMLCTGNPGVGKSVLASVVFDHLRTMYRGQDVVIANYYCSHFDEQSQDATHFCRVLLRQVCQSMNRLPSAVVEFYRDTRHQVVDVQWIQSLQTVLQRVISTCDQTFIVIDALDEMENVRKRNDLLNAIQEIRLFTTNLRVLATTRPHLAQLHAYFRNPTMVDISATQDDVQLFLRQRLAEDDIPEFIDEAFVEDIVARLSTSSSGTFLLPALQLDNVLQQLTKSDAKQALEELSQTLEEAFKTSIDRIRALSKPRRELAFRTMMWISYAKRPLNMLELQHALAIHEDDGEFDEDKIVPGRIVIEACAGLVQLDKETQSTTFVHFSLDEYLRSQAGLFPEGNISIVRACLRYLSYPSLKEIPVMNKDDELLHQFIGRKPLLRYAAYQWGMHAKEVRVIDYIKYALPFLNSTANILVVSRLRDLDNPYSRDWQKHSMSWAYSGGAAISIASAFGLPELVQHLLNDLPDKSVINRCRNVYGRVPLQDAAGYGHTDVCEILIAQGADLMANYQGRATAFFQAVSYGRLETAQALLIHNRGQLDIHCRFGWTALHKASDLGDEPMVQFLLSSGAIIAALDEKHRTPLHLASKRGHTQILKLLVLAGANVNYSSRKERPIDLCTTHGHLEATKYLIEQGANVNVRGNDGWSPLHRACRGGHLALVNLLLQHGANVLALDFHKNTPLLMACRSGKIETVQSLLCHNPDLRADLLQHMDAKKRNAEQLAFITAHFDIYKYLRDLRHQLQTGIEIGHDFISGTPSTLLAQSIEAKDLTTVELLLGQTPELVYFADASGHLPIHMAFIESSEDIASFLLEAGASIHSAGFHGWQPLHIAASTGSLEMTNLALTHGAEVDARTGTGQTPLLKASSANSVPVIQRLLEAGANVQARNDRGMTCLHVAASKDFIDGVREILRPEWEAQELVHSRDRNGNIPRNWADRSGRLDISTFLRLQERRLSSTSGTQAGMRTDSQLDLSRTSTNTSQVVSHGLRSAPSRTISSLSLVDGGDMQAQIDLLDLDSE